MSLLRKLFGGSKPERTVEVVDVGSGAEGGGHYAEVQSYVFEDATELVAAVGEASYQPALRQICGSDRWERVRFECDAALMPEPDNPHDRSGNAVAVYANCRGTFLHVGYLSRGDALDYRDVVRQATELGFTLACDAHIAGREQGSETPNLGIFLDLPTPSACLKQLDEPID